MAATVTIQLADNQYLSQSASGVTLSDSGSNEQSQWTISEFPDDGNATTAFSTIQNVKSGQYMVLPGPFIGGIAPATMGTDQSLALYFLIGGGPALNHRLPIKIVNGKPFQQKEAYLSTDSGMVAYVANGQAGSGWVIKQVG